ncbi:MAG: peroxisomal assembly protein [Heterodermia speciosa]|uniref:Peroxisomal ATPase PEX6 n=1 Tax=Heterodermia speciosa TaxID=116794 RepID=A0A8H3FD40_9LECA|nr:MAG: peroxisomal assembly protein [Heterodermia speciosa]
MEDEDLVMDHPKRRRRRKENRDPISATLVVASDLKGGLGLISEDLFQHLFDYQHYSALEEDGESPILHAAITPWSPNTPSLIDEAVWTILPVRKAAAGAHSTLTVPTKSTALKLLEEAIGPSPLERDCRSSPGLEIRIIDVQPLVLDLVVISVDGDALDQHEDVQARFGGGFSSTYTNGSTNKSKGKNKSVPHGSLESTGSSGTRSQEDRLTGAVRDALTSLPVIHQHENLPLPLPTHPITHVPLPPAKIIYCEPVNQGIVAPSTRIVIDRESRAKESRLAHSSLAYRGALKNLMAEEEDEASNESYYSAEEDDENGVLPASGSDCSTSADESSDEANSDSDSSENIISMTTPALARVSPGIQSSLTAATPRANGEQIDGIRTPGSVYSNYTATTARNDTAGLGRLFTPRALLRQIPNGLLHPKPAIDEDDGCRIFVDVKLLLKLGCFSGDWVKVETAQIDKGGHWGLNTFKDDDNEVGDFSVMKVYGLPGLSPAFSARKRTTNVSSRRSSFNNAPYAQPITPEAWLSPLFLANLGNPQSIRLTLLSTTSGEGMTRVPKLAQNKIPGSMMPPIAKELTLLSIPTPLSTELGIQSSMMAAIKDHFHYKRRILRQGDLIAVVMDVTASRLLGQTSPSFEIDSDLQQLLAINCGNRSTIKTDRGAAWYRVAQIVSGQPDQDPPLQEQNVWGGTFSVEPGSTRMTEAGRGQSRIPKTDQQWEYYLGLKATPKSPAVSSIIDIATGKTSRPHVTPLRRRLRELIAASTCSRAIELKMDPVVILLYSNQRNIGKATVASQAASDIGNHIFTIDGYELTTEGTAGGADIKTEAIFQARIERAISCGLAFTVVLVRHVEALTADRMITAFKDAASQCRVIIATTTDIDKIPDAMRGLFTHEIEVTAPDEVEREHLLCDIIQERGISITPDVDLAAIAVKSAALVAGDLVDIVERATVIREDRLTSLLQTNSSTIKTAPIPLIRDIIVSGGSSARCVTKLDFSSALEAARKNFADAIGAPKIPNVSWDDVGGLTNVKDAVMETIQLPLERPELFAKGMKKRSGILFYGPPGTGKTLLAKAIATEFSLNFFSVKGPELLNMYIGESEANVRRVFQRARDARPCVVFFDELDSVAPKRGNQGDSGGVMDRIVSQILAELDGMSDGEQGARGGVFVIGATNRPDLLDQALLRPGRFDKMLYLGVADSHDKQLTILEALTRKFTLDPSLDLRMVAESLPFTYTGADLYALASDAMLKAITRQADAVDRKIKTLPGGPVTTAYFFDHLATEADIAVRVTEADFEVAKRDLVGSVSAKELEHYARVQASFEGSDSKEEKSQRNLAPHSIKGPMPTRAKDRKKPVGETAGVEDVFTEPKGKGKVRRLESSDDDDDEAYITSNDFQATPEKPGRSNGAAGFGAGSIQDEEAMYG